MGNLETEVEMCRRLVTNCNAVVLDVDYRLALEFPFPIGVDDSWDALQWLRISQGVVSRISLTKQYGQPKMRHH